MRCYAETSLGQVHMTVGGRGFPVVLLPMAGRSGRMFRDVASLLSDAWRVVAVDTPGSGGSDPLPSGATIDDLARGTFEALDGIGVEACHVYGLHSGNKIAAAMAVREPARVARLILAGQSHSLIPDREQRNATIVARRGPAAAPPAPDRSLLAAWAATFRSVSGLWWEAGLFGHGSVADRLERLRDRIADELADPRGSTELYRANFAFDLAAALSAVRAPTLVLEIATPEEDRAIGRQGEALASRLRDGRVAVIEEPFGHTLTLENRPGDLAATVNAFLRADP